MELIDKSALIAEIEKRKNWHQYQNTAEESGAYYEDGFILDIINSLDTLDVKDVDLEKEIKNYLDNQPIVTRSKGIDYKLVPSPEVIAKHFYELGLKTKKGE